MGLVKTEHKMWPEGQEMQCILIKEFKIPWRVVGHVVVGCCQSMRRCSDLVRRY
jgi:hypothetical protein